jgi:pimeloyl-ACP methyl ester carboxylesterase
MAPLHARADDRALDSHVPDDHVPDDIRVPVADGIALHARRWPGAGRPYLLVHGLSSNARLWDVVASTIAAAGHDVTAIDLRSHGESDAPERGYDTATAADDVARVARSLNVVGAVVAGQSWGADVVVQVAARHPEVVSALALLDGGWSELHSKFGSWPECAQRFRPAEIDGMPADDMRGHLRDAHPDWHPAAIEATLASLEVGPDGTIRRRLSIDHHMAILRSMWDDPPSRYYPDVRVPVLLMPALPANAEGNPPEVVRAAVALPTASIRAYAGADHDIHAQHPAQVAADLLAIGGAR